MQLVSKKDSVVWAGLLADLSLIHHNRAPLLGKFLYDKFLDNVRILFLMKENRKRVSFWWEMTDDRLTYGAIECCNCVSPSMKRRRNLHRLSCSFSLFCIVRDYHHRGSEEVAFNKLFQGLGWFWGFGLERPYKGVKTQTCYFISIYSQESRPQS